MRRLPSGSLWVLPANQIPSLFMALMNMKKTVAVNKKSKAGVSNKPFSESGSKSSFIQGQLSSI